MHKKYNLESIEDNKKWGNKSQAIEFGYLK